MVTLACCTLENVVSVHSSKPHSQIFACIYMKGNCYQDIKAGKLAGNSTQKKSEKVKNRTRTPHHILHPLKPFPICCRLKKVMIRIPGLESYCREYTVKNLTISRDHWSSGRILRRFRTARLNRRCESGIRGGGAEKRCSGSMPSCS